MDQDTIQIALKAYLTEMCTRLHKAASIARVAEACALAGDTAKGVEVALEIEALIYDVNTFLNAASMINRLEPS